MEFEVVIVKPAELILKSKQVRKNFEQILIRNIKSCLKQKEIEFDRMERRGARILIYSPEPEEVMKDIQTIFGIVSLSLAVEIGTEISALKRTALELALDTGLNKDKTFGVRVKKATESSLKARDLESEIGADIQKHTKAKVNLTKPDIWVRIEIINKHAFLFTEVVRGLGGLPLGVSGKAVCLISDSKESALAAWMIMKRGCEVFPLHLRSDEKENIKFRKNCSLLEKFAWGSKIKPHSIKSKFTLKNALSEAEKLAKETKAKAIVLGSRKIPKNLKAKLPIFTPLIGFEDKDIQKQIKQIF